MTKTIFHKKILDTVKLLILKTNTNIPNDIKKYINTQIENNKNLSDQELLFTKIIQENQNIAKKEKLPLCQDTGLSVFFINFGEQIIIDYSESNYKTKTISSIVNTAVSEVYNTDLLRPSIISDPLNGFINTNDNTPAIVHIEHNDSDKLEISYMAKGGGSENSSASIMLSPVDGFAGIKKFVINQYKTKGINACPPLLIGIGIGGSFDYSAMLSKKALFRQIGQRNNNKFYANKEEELLHEINSIGFGVFGLEGKLGAIDVFIETEARHMATLPVSVSFLCHAARRGSIIL